MECKGEQIKSLLFALRAEHFTIYRIEILIFNHGKEDKASANPSGSTSLTTVL
jgi:hypothetical protein